VTTPTTGVPSERRQGQTGLRDSPTGGPVTANRCVLTKTENGIPTGRKTGIVSIATSIYSTEFFQHVNITGPLILILTKLWSNRGKDYGVLLHGARSQLSLTDACEGFMFGASRSRSSEVRGEARGTTLRNAIPKIVSKLPSESIVTSHKWGTLPNQ